MKKLLLTAALALSLVLPMSLLSSDASANWYRANNPGSWVDMYSEAGHRKGSLRCRVPHDDYLKPSGRYRSPDPNYIYVKWMRPLYTMEWHWRDGMNNSWCPIWKRHGFVEKKLLRTVPVPPNAGSWIN